MNCDVTGRVPVGPDRKVWPFMHALGRGALPERVRSGGREFGVVRFVKHDFFAATGFYEDVVTREWAVLKLSRTESFLGLPMRWLGRRICRRELRFYEKMADLQNVPAVIGLVGDTGFLHAYVPGRPLEKGVAVPDGFFAEWSTLINTLAVRGIAVVDTNKPENILLGDDGRPHLIDFQISYDIQDLHGVWPARRILRLLTATDHYHLLKHKRRMRPDQMTPAEWDAVNRRTWLIRLHRRLTWPYFVLRRRLFAHLRASGRLMPEGSK